MSKHAPIKLMQIMLGLADGGAENFFEKMSVGFQQHEAIQQQWVVTAPNQRRIKELSEAGCQVHAVQASGLIGKLRARGSVQGLANQFKPEVVLTYMNRASKAAPRLANGVVVGRLGGYYNLKNYQGCDYLVANTPMIHQHIIKGGWPEKRTRVISNFGEVAGSKKGDSLKESMGIHLAQKVLLSLGRLHEVKAHDVTIRALKQLTDCVLLIGGEGLLRAELEALAVTEGVADRVKLLGWRRDLADLFATADVCILPSRSEPLGGVIMESWAREVPIVASRSDGPSWLIQQGQNGLLFDIDDVDGLAQTVKQVLLQPELFEQLREVGLATYHQDYTREVILGRYVELFQSLLAHKRGQA